MRRISILLFFLLFSALYPCFSQTDTGGGGGGSGGGGNLSGSGTVGVIAEFSASHTLGNSGCDEGVTTPNVLTCTDSAGAAFKGVALTGALTGTGNYIPVTLLNSGTAASSTTFWRGDGTWASPISSGTLGQPAIYTGLTAIGSLNTVKLTSSGDPVYDVTASAYGADPTGVSDSLAAVEAAMTAACATSPSGAVVWFPPGTYTFSAPIPNTSTFWCNGMSIIGAGVRATQLNFASGSGFAFNTPANLRNFDMRGFLIQVGGGSGGSNNGLGGIGLGNFNFSSRYQEIYIIGPTTSTAAGFSTNGDATQAFISLDDFRVDNFGGTGGTAYDFELSGTGDQLYCHKCYTSGAYNGFHLIGWYASEFDMSASDNCTHECFYISPGNGNTFIGTALTSESATGNAFFLNFGGTIILTNPKVQGFNGTSTFPFEVFNMSGDITITAPVTTGNVGSNTASFDVSGSPLPHGITISDAGQYLDKGFSAAALSYLGQGQGNILSNSNGSFSVTNIGQPSAPTVTCHGACAGGTWGYEIVAFDAVGNPTQASSAGTATNATTLTGTNYNAVAITVDPGAVSYNVYRTTSAGTPANLSLVCSGLTIGIGLTCNDTGAVNTASVTPNSLNSTGSLTAQTYSTFSANKAVIASNFTSANASGLQVITGLLLNIPAGVKQVPFHCSIYYSQATPSASDQFGVAALTTAPTNLRAWATVQTSGLGTSSAFTTGDSGNIGSTTPTSIVTFTPAGSTENIANIDGSIKTTATGPTGLQFYVTNGTAADVIVIGLQSYCVAY